MNDSCYACDWILAVEEAKYIFDLIHIARNLDIELIRGSIPKGSTTDEGYFVVRFLIQVPSSDAYQEFLQQIPQGTAFANWFPVSSDEYQRQRHWEDNRRKATLPEMLDSGDLDPNVFARGGVWNLKIREKLDAGTVLYFGHNWLVPLQSENAITLPDEKSTQYERYRGSVLVHICDLAESLGRVHSIRAGEQSKSAQGLSFQQLIARFFSVGEFEKFLEQTGMERSSWYSVTEDQYKAAYRIMEHNNFAEIRSFYLEIERMGQENNLILRNIS